MSTADRRAGFTLLELAAVMLIVALLATLAVLMTPGSGRSELKAVTLAAAALLRRERIGALLTGRERAVSLDGVSRKLIGDSGDIVAIPRDITLDVLSAREEAPRLTVVRFRPDGASTGAALRFSREKVRYEIHVNWYTGGVAIVE
jgi:general secretion pathway protein H